MKLFKRTALLAVLVAACAAAALATGALSNGSTTAAASGPCQLGTKAGQVKHVIYLQFDNTHYRRDRAERRVGPRADAAPPELPQGQRHAADQRPHDPDLAHGRRDPGVADRPLPRSQRADRVEQLRLLQERRHAAVHLVVQVLDRHGRRHERHAAEHDHRRRPDHTRPVGAPTRAPAATSAASRRANIELENNSTTALGRHDAGLRRRLGRVERGREPGDAGRSRSTDFVGIAVHCAQGDALCDEQRRSAKPDDSTTIPGSTTATRRSSARSTSTRRSPAGSRASRRPTAPTITDPAGNCGFPGFDGMLAKNTLG